MADNISFRLNQDSRRYEVLADGSLAGFTEINADNGTVAFNHTEVFDDYAGQGLASQLARHAMDDVVAAGKTIVPYCEYMAAWLHKHPEYEPNVEWPESPE